MPKFVCSMVYDLSSDTPPDARKLLRAELVGRRWKDRVRKRLMPRNMVWMLRPADETDTTSDLHDACTEDLLKAARAVKATGRAITVLRAWVHVSGGGTYGLAGEDAFRDSPPGADEAPETNDEVETN